VKLSVSIIFAELSARFPQTALRQSNAEDNALSLASPYYYSGRTELRAGHVYVIAASQLPRSLSADGHCLLITADASENFSARQRISLITVGGGADTDAVYNCVLSIFDKYRAWDDNLRNLIFTNASISEYLSQSLPLINLTMSVHDSSGRYLAWAGISMLPKPDIAERNFVEPKFLQYLDGQTSSSVFSAKNIIHFYDKATNGDFLLLNLFSGNSIAGRMIVSSHTRIITEREIPLIEYLGKYLDAALKHAAFSGEVQNPRKDALLSVLNGNRHNESRIRQLRTISPYGRAEQYQSLYCLFCTCRDSNISNQYAAYQIEMALPDSVAVLFNSAIVVLCANYAGQTTNSFFDAIRELSEKHSLTIGCSDPFLDFHYLSLYCKQAESSLQLGEQSEKSGGGAIYRFKDYALEHFLRYGCSVLPSRLICSDCITKLSERDKSAAVSYCESLRVYLDTGRNASETARRLGVSRNTFLTRLERISLYLDLDLENADDRLYAEISLRLVRGG